VPGVIEFEQILLVQVLFAYRVDDQAPAGTEVLERLDNRPPYGRRVDNTVELRGRLIPRVTRPRGAQGPGELSFLFTPRENLNFGICETVSGEFQDEMTRRAETRQP